MSDKIVIKGKFIKCDYKSRGRFYPQSIMDREIKLQKKLEADNKWLAEYFKHRHNELAEKIITEFLTKQI